MPGGHQDGPCWYDQPHKARQGWKPYGKAPYTAIMHYKRKCAEYGIMPQLPPEFTGAAAVEQPSSAIDAGAAIVQGAVVSDSSCSSSAAASTSASFDGWYTAGSLLHAQQGPYVAAVSTHGKQPHNFLPPNNIVD